VKEGDAEALVIEALDWATRYKKIEKIAKELPTLPRRRIRKIPERLFPPCVKKILEGLSDGRKRSVFILTTFLRTAGWKDEEIEKKIHEWNEKNYPPLRASYLRTQLRWHFRQERNLLPPGCDHPVFYKDMGLGAFCEECKKTVGEIKNPINYPFRLMKRKV
jgi:DNA primase large subunit